MTGGLYLALKALHLLAVVLFLGNIITGVFWKRHADATNDPRVMAHTMAGIMKSDLVFTIPGVFLIVFFGFAAAMVGRLPMLSTPWIMWSIVLFTISGAAFVAQVAPLQRKLHALASAAVDHGTFDRAEYDRLSRRWEVWGAIAVLTPLAAFVLMIAKPT